MVNGVLKRIEDASLPIDDLALLRGYGIFDFFRLSNGVPLFMDDHLDRFYYGAAKARLPVSQSKEELRSKILELISRNNMPVSGIRIVLTGGTGEGAYKIGKPNLVVTQEPIHFPTEEMYCKGIKLITHEYLRDLPQVKTINYMTGIWLQDEIQRQGAFDVLYYHKGIVHELTRSNLFMVRKDGAIQTPKENVLPGITRKHIIRAIQDNYPIDERSFSMGELYAAKEVFLTGTTKKVLPVRQIDDHLYGDPGEVTKDVMRMFEEVEITFSRISNAGV